MVEIKIRDDNINVSGTFDFGYMGIYREEELEFVSSPNEIREWDIVNGCGAENDEQLSEFLTGYYNDFERKIQKNIKQVNDNFLANIICDFNNVGAFFWEIEEITIKENLPDGIDEDYNIVYEPFEDELSHIEDEFYETPNDGSLEKTDVEAFIRKSFPMLDLDRLIAGVVPEHVCFGDGCISFQCSDAFGEEVLCGAYDELNENLTFTDWHNF